ncbi:MAG: tetratricopeptide repeat protein, partial [Methanococcaceae archaeon]
MMKKTLLLGVILFLSSVSLVTAQQTDSTGAKTMDPKAATFYNNGIKLMIAGKYTEAAAAFDSSLQVAKDNKTYFQKGLALQKAGNVPEARKAYLASLAIDSTYDKAYLNLANLSLAEKNYPEAINLYKKVQRISKDQKTKDDAEQSIALANDNMAIEYFNKGNELSKANKFDEAIQNYDKSLAISKDYKTYYQKGITLSKMEKPQDAIEAFNASIAANKTFDQAYIALASV